MQRVGFVGLGTMGGPMARNLVRKGLLVKGFDINASAIDAHVAAGGTAATSPADTADGTEVVVTMLPNGPDVERAILGDEGVVHKLVPGMVVIDMSTVDPATTRRIGSALAERGVHLIDSPVGKSLDHAIAGTLALMVGGDPVIIERVRPILDCMGTDFFYCGPLGMGEAMKLTNNCLSAATLAATIEAVVVGTQAGLSFDLMSDVMRSTFAWNHHLAASVPNKVLAGDIDPGFMVKLCEKDLGLALDLSRQLGVDTPISSVVHGIFSEAKRSGLAEKDVTSVLCMMESKLGISVPRKKPVS